jgi:hypothetical protein
MSLGRERRSAVMEACDQTRPGLGGERRRWLETAASRAESSTDHTERTRWWICKEKMLDYGPGCACERRLQIPFLFAPVDCTPRLICLLSTICIVLQQSTIEAVQRTSSLCSVATVLPCVGPATTQKRNQRSHARSMHVLVLVGGLGSSSTITYDRDWRSRSFLL